MNAGFGSAVESIRQRAKVSRGRRGERERRACKAASLADLRACEGDGDGILVGSVSLLAGFDLVSGFDCGGDCS